MQGLVPGLDCNGQDGSLRSARYWPFKRPVSGLFPQPSSASAAGCKAERGDRINGTGICCIKLPVLKTIELGDTGAWASWMAQIYSTVCSDLVPLVLNRWEMGINTVCMLYG